MKSSFLKRALKRIRSIGTFWIAEQTARQVEAIRAHELGVVLSLLPPEGKLLEIGAGTGWQSRTLADRGYDVSAIDVPSSDYRASRVFPVQDYDGDRIPFADNTFDIVFSSNTLEHIPRVREFQSEIHRVLKPGGRVVHVVPSSSWRLYTNVSYVLKYWTAPTIHGAHARNAWSEIACFRYRRWSQLFSETGWKVVERRSNGLFYTGSSIMDTRLSIGARRMMSRIMGGSCHVFLLREDGPL
jgi:2-polyprenyl-3-methyl-5-hydroxy-6-metoxy-1,4-benzoquinol methylase